MRITHFKLKYQQYNSDSYTTILIGPYTHISNSHIKIEETPKYGAYMGEIILGHFPIYPYTRKQKKKGPKQSSHLGSAKSIRIFTFEHAFKKNLCIYSKDHRC